METVIDIISSHGKFLLIASLLLGSIGLVFGFGLGILSKVLHVDVDPKIAAIEEVLPQANCGACGYPGCAAYAEAIVNEGCPINLCTPGGEDVLRRIADITGKEAVAVSRQKARVQCQGGNSTVGKRFLYNGIQDCNAAVLLENGDKNCPYGCLGYGSCADVCPFDAIIMSDDGLPVVDDNACTGCGKCVDACPRDILILTPAKKKVYMGCISHDPGKTIRKYCAVGCIGCGKCVKVCPVDGAITFTGTLAVIDPQLCISCAKCVDVCPTNSIVDKLKRKEKRERKEAANTEPKQVRQTPKEDGTPGVTA